MVLAVKKSKLAGILAASSFLVMSATAASAKAEGKWNVYGGASVSHKFTTEGFKGHYGWGGGGYIGAGYEIPINSNWSVTPQAELNFANNGAKFSGGSLEATKSGVSKNINEANILRYGAWDRILYVNVPILVNYRCMASENLGLRFSVGASFQEALVGQTYTFSKINKNGANEVNNIAWSSKKTRIYGNAWDRFNTAGIAEIGIEPKGNLSYMVRGKYNLLNASHFGNRTLELSAGVKYAF